MRRELASESEAFDYICREVYDRCRIRLDERKHALIRARLGKRMREHRFKTLSAYCNFLRSSAQEGEFTILVDSLATNFTHFMREPEHFRFLVGPALSSMLAPGQKGIRVWSAACSSGEEAYTIAFFLETHFPLSVGWDWSVTASDVSTKVLETARKGIYTEERVRQLPAEWLPRYFQKGVGEWKGFYRVKRSISERISFQQLNLVKDYNHARPFQVIFCRNVMIYFDRPTQEQLVRRLAEFLTPGGYLMIGHSESLSGLGVPFRCIRPSIYQME